MDDLDKLIAEQHEETPSWLEAIGRGAAQGASLGFGDEFAGTARALGASPAEWLYRKLHPDEPQAGPGFAQFYSQGRDENRAANAAAERAWPKLYAGSNIVGGAAPAVLAALATGGAAALPIALGEGGLAGLGNSTANDVTGLARDAGAGVAAGALGYGAGAALGKGFSSLAGIAGRKGSAAAARAGEMATQDVDEQGATLAGHLGAETQKGSRTMEFFKHFYDLLTPEQQTAFKQKMLESGEGQRLIQSIADNYLESGPQQFGAIAQRRAAVDAFKASRAEAIAARTAELRTPQFGKDAMSFAKAYAEPVAAMTLAGALGMGPAGEAAAGVVFGRTRAGKALMSRINRPGNAEAFWSLVQGGADRATSPSTLGTLFRGGLMGGAVAPVAAAASGRLDDRAAQAAALEKLLRAQGTPIIDVPTPRVGQHPAEDDLDKLLNEGSR